MEPIKLGLRKGKKSESMEEDDMSPTLSQRLSGSYTQDLSQDLQCVTNPHAEQWAPDQSDQEQKKTSRRANLKQKGSTNTPGRLPRCKKSEDTDLNLTAQIKALFGKTKVQFKPQENRLSQKTSFPSQDVT